MGSIAHILKNWEKHDPEKVIRDISLVCFKTNVMFIYRNNKTFFNDGKLESVSFTLADDQTMISSENNKQFELTLQGVNLDDIAVGLDKDMDYLVPNEKLCSLVYIEDVNEDNTELILKFALEYLRLNPSEYFWFEGDWVYSLAVIEKNTLLPFDKDWCFKQPK